MAYRLKIKDRSVGHAVRRIADEQIGKALVSIEELDADEAIHDVRKRCKKVRGLIRLVRPVFDDYRAENAAFRDAARNISGTRDAEVMQETYDLLMDEFADQIERRAFGPIRQHFTLERKSRTEFGETDRKLEETRRFLLEAQQRAQEWELSEDGWSAIQGGLRKTYKRARDAASRARSSPNGEIFHELRKQIKYHWNHCRILEPVWPDMMGLRNRAARHLSDILGQHHDLEVFANRLSASSARFASQRDVEAAIGLARAHQERLEQTVWPKLDRLLAQSPATTGEHLEALWFVWKHDRP